MRLCAEALCRAARFEAFHGKQRDDSDENQRKHDHIDHIPAKRGQDLARGKRPHRHCGKDQKIIEAILMMIVNEDSLSQGKLVEVLQDVVPGILTIHLLQKI